MTETYKKIDKDTLEVTRIANETHITEEDRAEIQTQIDHLEIDKVEIQKKIEALKEKIAILDA